MLSQVFPSETESGEAMFAVEVSLLHCDAIFEAKSNPGDNLIRGHLIISHMLHVEQIIQGVKFDFLVCAICFTYQFISSHL